MSDIPYLHDASFESVVMDIKQNVVRIHVTRYISPDSADRFASVIEFRNVESFSGLINFKELASNAWAGNIEDWEPASEVGFSYIYLVRGTICIFSDPPVVT